MATKKKLLQAAAGNAGGAGLDVNEVFSTYLYTGTGSSQTITNGIDLSGEGGLVWTKRRAGGNSNYSDHWLVDSERGDSYGLRSNLTNAQFQDSSLGFSSSGYTAPNSIHFTQNATDYASWTWRKAPKFFDVVTYTGDGTTNDGSSRLISHNLGSTPGFYIVKRTDAANNWRCFHRSLGATKAIQLNGTGSAITSSGWWADVAPTDTNFSVTFNFNETNANYVVYLFAHNDSGDGEFGPDGDQDIIKCGSFVPSSTWQSVIDIGFEPQWIMYKKATGTGEWNIVDSMRGVVSGAADPLLTANSSAAEVDYVDSFNLHANGFEQTFSSTDTNTYIYIAIRRGPLAPPESATEVFAIDQQNSSEPYWTSNFPVDFQFVRRKDASDSWYSSSRLLQGKELVLNSTAAEGGANIYKFDYMNGWGASSYASDAFSWMWKRAPSYMDVVAYTGDGTTARAISHNLAVPPQLMIHKRRNATNDWYVPDFINSKLLLLNANAAAYDTSILANYYGSGNGSSGGASSVVIPDASTFTVTPNINVNGSGDTYIAYLFASLAGISKVGSVTHSGTTNVDCGFSSGARFVLLKRTDASGDWYIWDSTRGIVSGNDPYLLLNSTTAEVTNTDYIDPLSSGFTITSSFTAGDYIFYAIA